MVFSIVETIENGEKNVIAVPTDWILGGKILFWPDNPKEVQKFRKNLSPPEGSWIQLDCKILHRGIGDFKSALTKEKLYEEYSNSESEKLSKFKKIQKRSHPIHHNIIDEYNLNDMLDFNPNLGVSELSVTSNLGAGSSSSKSGASELLAASRQDTESSSPNLGTVHEQIEYLQSEDQETEYQQSCQTVEIIPAENLQNFCTSCKILQKDIEEIKNKIDLIENSNAKILLNMEELLHFKEINLQSNEEVLFDFPIHTIEEIDELKSRIRADAIFKNALRTKLVHFGGKNANATARNICNFLFTDEVLEKFSWAGTVSKQVFSKYLEVIQVFSNAVRKQFPEFTNSDTASFFKEHLKHARFRLQKKNKKEKNNEPTKFLLEATKE